MEAILKQLPKIKRTKVSEFEEQNAGGKCSSANGPEKPRGLHVASGSPTHVDERAERPLGCATAKAQRTVPSVCALPFAISSTSTRSHEPRSERIAMGISLRRRWHAQL